MKIRTRLFAPVTDDAALAQEGLSSRLSAFLDTPSPVEVEATPTPAATVPAKPAASADTPPPKVADTPPPIDKEDKEDEEEFHQIGSTAPAVAETAAAPESFDEAAFDSATEEEVKGMDAAQGSRWKTLKQGLKAAKLEAAEAIAKLASAPVPSEVQAELESLRSAAQEVEGLRQRNQELLRANDTVAVRESEVFLAKVKVPLDAMDVVLKQMSDDSGVDIDTLASVIMEPNPIKQDNLLEQLESKLGRRVTGRLERLADDYKAVKQVEVDMLADASKTIAASRVQREAAAKADLEARVGQFKAATNQAFKKFAGRVPGFTDSAGQLTDLARAVQNSTVTLDPSSFDSGDLGYMAFCANAFPEARKAIVALERENAILRGGKGNPSALTGDPVSPKPADTPPKEGGLLAAMEGRTFTFEG